MTEERTALCVACASEISGKARICPHCHVDQRTWWRSLKRATAAFSGVSVVFGVITIAISLLPKAYETLFYVEKVDVFTVKPKVSRGRGIVTFVNKGLGNVFVNEARFEPVDTETYPIKAKNIVVNRWVNRGEVLSFPFSRTPFPGSSIISPSGFSKRLKEFGSEYHQKFRGCFKLEVLDKAFRDPGISPIVSSAIESIPVKTLISYSSMKSKGVRRIEAAKQLEAHILFNEQCEKN